MGKPRVQKRFIHDERFQLPDQTAWQIINDWLYKCGFQPFDYWGEQIYKSGDGIMSAARNVKITYYQGYLHMEYWLRAAGGKEMDLNGVYAVAVKKNAKKQIDDLLQMLRTTPQTYAPQQGQQPYMQQGQQPYMQQGQQPYMQQGQTPDNGQPPQVPRYNNTAALKTAGFIAVLMAVLIIVFAMANMAVGYLGILVSVIGIQQSLVAIKGDKKGLAYFILIINIIECALMTVLFIAAIKSMF